ncbi:hypothetical protein H0H92_002402 [Tricholoma furcatifolium]|nr:hypothetical protein H0H92_002402 [Tricholoma furcatifolium]
MSRALSSLRLPGSTLSQLTAAGYTTVQDLQGISTEKFAQELKIHESEAETILSLSVKRADPTQAPLHPSLTQSAASMVTSGGKITTGSRPVDELLSGGLSRGQIVEISGPPGTPKEAIAIGIVRSFVEAGHEVLFVDCLNMTSPAVLDQALRISKTIPENYARLVYHTSCLNLHELMIYIHHLQKTLESHPKLKQDLSGPSRKALLEKIKQIFTVALSSHRIAIVTTSQLSTKMLNADGSPGSFDTGAKGILVPQLGLDVHRKLLAAI